MNRPPKSRKTEIVVQEVENEVLVYDLNNNEVFCLNQTSAIIWQLCDGQNSIAEISQKLGKKLDTPVDEGFVWLALDQLKKENLIENEVTTPLQFEGLTRRQIIKKIGLGSMIAFPLVSSVIAPTSANAQSPLGVVVPSGLCDPSIGGVVGATCNCPNATVAGCSAPGPYTPGAGAPGLGTGCPGGSCSCVSLGANNSDGVGFRRGVCA